MVDVVIEPHCQQALGVVQQSAGVQTAGCCHPAHIGLVAGLQPALQGGRAQLHAFAAWNASDADRFESFGPGAVTQRFTECLPGWGRQP